MQRTIIRLAIMGALVLPMACESSQGDPVGEPDVQTGDIGFADVNHGPIDLTPPTITIQTPFQDQLFQEGDPVPLVATVLDDLDLPGTLSVTWHSSLDGELVVVEPNDEGFAVADQLDMTAGNHVITASARDNSGKVSQDHVNIVVNGAPAAPIVLITPESPSTVDDLEAVLSVPAIDPNRGQEEVYYSWRWFRDGEDMDVPIPTVYAQKTARGETWEVRVRASDPYGKSIEVTESVVIGNQRPSCGQAVVLPSTGWTDTPFDCSCADWSDGDPGDVPQDTCTWIVSGVIQDGDGSCSLPPSATSKGQSVACLLTPNDGLNEGDTVQSPNVSVLNSAPEKPTIALTPAEGDALTIFSCAVLDDPADADGDEVTFETSWIVEDYVNPGTTSANVYPTNLVSEEGGSAAGKGDTIRCRVRSTDGDTASTWVESESLVLSNAPPQGGLALVGPENASEADTLKCQTTAVEDPDGDEVSWTYVWKVDGEVLEGQTGETLPPHTVAAGSKVTCDATPDDGEANGETVTSKNQVTVSNAPPTLPDLAIEAPAGAEGPVLCVLLEQPVDATEVVVSVEWTLGQGDPFGGEDHLDADQVSSCDVVACRISVSDGEETLWSPWVETQLPVGVDCDDDDVCTSHSCLPLGGCLSEQNTAPCDDGDACTVQDTCTLGACVGSVKNCDDSNPCTVDACDPTAGCTHATDLDQCDDGNTCTVDSCNPQTGGCSWVPVVDGTGCDADSNGCTLLDTCESGSCLPGAPAPCGVGTTACKLLSCQSTGPETYTCETGYADDTVPCDDGFFCTVDDTCNGEGACLGGPARDCSQGQGACNIGLCDELNNDCKIIPREDGTPCDADGNGCTQNDACSEGLCLAGESADCSILDADCSQGSCVSVGAEGFDCTLIPAPAGLPCDDGDACTVTASCDGEGQCDGGIPLDCEAEASGQCQTGYCDPVAQGCVVVKVLDGTPCDDGNICSSDDMCQNGLCLAQGDACGEELIDVEVTSNRTAALGSLGFGRYVTQWATGGVGKNVFRITDRVGSREAEEKALPNTKFTPPRFPLTIASHLSGDFLVLGNDGNYGCVDNANSNCEVNGAVLGYLYDLSGTLVTSAEFWEVTGDKGTGEGITSFNIDQRVIPFSFDDGSWGALTVVTNNSSQETSPPKNRLHFVPIGSQLLAGDLVEVLGPGTMSGDLFDVERIGGDELLVVWVDSDGTSIVARYMDRFGTWLGPPVTVHTINEDHRIVTMEIATHDDGGAVIAWTVDTSQDETPATDVEALRIDEDLVPTGAVVTVTGAKPKDQELGGVDCFSDGSFVVVYEDASGDVSGSGVLASRYGDDDAPLGKSVVHVNVFDDQYLPSVLVLPGDEFVVAFLSAGGHLYTRRFDIDGVPAMGALENRAVLTSEGNQSQGDAAHDDDGNALIVVQSPFAGNSGTEIVARLYDNGGSPLTSDIMVNADLGGDQVDPAADGHDGTYVVVWSVKEDSGGEAGVFGRLLDENGDFKTEVFTVAQTSSSPSSTDVSMTSQGAFLVSWVEGAKVHARALDDNGEVLGPTVELDDNLSVDHSEPVSAGPLAGDHFVVSWVGRPDVGAKTRIYARRVSSSGALEGNAIELGAGETASASQIQPAITRGSAGYGLACWQSTHIEPGKSKNGVGCQRFDQDDLELVGAVFTPHDEFAPGDFSAPAVTLLSSGQFVVAFQIEDVDGDEHAIQAQRISQTGASVDARVVVNRTWSGDQTAPFVVGLAGVGTPFVAGWVTTEEESLATDVLFRVLKGE